MKSKEIARKRILDFIGVFYESFKDFERDFGLKPNTVSEWKRGVSTYMDILPELANRFGVTTDYLLGNNPRENPDYDYAEIIGDLTESSIIKYEKTHAYEDVIISAEVAPTASLFALRIVGNSYAPLAMNNDVIICDSIVANANGRLCLITLDDKTYVKRMKADSEGISLYSINPLEQELRLSKSNAAKHGYKIEGVLIQMVRRF